MPGLSPSGLARPREPCDKRQGTDPHVTVENVMPVHAELVHNHSQNVTFSRKRRKYDRNSLCCRHSVHLRGKVGTDSHPPVKPLPHARG